MDKNIKSWLSVTLFALLFLILTSTVTGSGVSGMNFSKLLVSSFVLFASMTIRDVFIYDNDKYFNYGKVIIIIDLFFVFILSRYDYYYTSKMLFGLLISEAIIFYSLRFGFLATLNSFIYYIFSGYLVKGFSELNEFINYISTFTIGVIFVFFSMSVIKYLLNQKNLLLITMDELSSKNKELSEAYLKIEQMTKIKERNRIAAEVHDTVGHTLTTVLVELEAVKIHIKNNNDESIRKLDLAIEQIRNGLNEIRHSIRNIKRDTEEISFLPAVTKLMDEVEKYSNVKINKNISIDRILSKDAAEALIKSLKEGITNGIRHGRATEFQLTVINTKNEIKLTLKDNGQGCEIVNKGFGLSAISERIEALNGAVEAEADDDIGFSLKIRIPL